MIEAKLLLLYLEILLPIGAAGLLEAVGMLRPLEIVALYLLE